jgi:ubiquitin C-terminal hydrolase
MLNSCLQVFFSISQLSEFFIDRYFSGNFISRALSSSFAQMFLTRTMLKNGKIDTSPIRNHLIHNFPQIAELSFTQLFRLIIDELIEEYEENDFLVKTVFNGRVLRETTCLACDFKKEEEENFNDLTLEVCKTLDRSFEIFNREDRIMSFCTSCNQVTNTSQRNTVVQPPNFLVLHLKRFVQSPYLHKNNLITDINKKLVMNEEKFSLKGMVFHEGEINTGEYLLYSKVNSKWYLYKGKKASKVSQDDVLSLPGLIYIYEKQF